MGGESPVAKDALAAASEHIDAAGLAAVAREPPGVARTQTRPRTDARIALARDGAFCFIYPATVEVLRERAEVVTFAPTDGDSLPECDGVYLPGGYPERHADALASSPALDELAARAADGLPVFGECGGLLTLGESLTTADGETYEMAGVLPASFRMHERYQALDHVRLRAQADALTASAGETRTGHEFHYSSADVAGDARFVFDVERGDGIHDQQDGLSAYRTLGTYCHVHPESGAFDTFLKRVASGR
jgi:cobyrinic acid a,c-diamide synthase